jgi:hypothetical protein
MVLSANQNQVRKHAPAVLAWRERLFRPVPERAMLLWTRINLEAAEFGETDLRDNYLRVRFEDLCSNPVETTAQVMNFLGARVDPEPIARAEISPALIVTLEELGRDALQKFRYLA